MTPERLQEIKALPYNDYMIELIDEVEALWREIARLQVRPCHVCKEAPLT